MRNIDWTQALSDEDVAWLRQAGFMSEYQISQHQAQFEADVPEDEVSEDGLTKSAMDPDARIANRVPGTGDGSPQLIVPTEVEDDEEEPEADDYDRWKLSELETEVENRNKLEDTSDVTVEGTGKDGKVLKADLIKGLRLWDAENPDALKD